MAQKKKAVAMAARAPLTMAGLATELLGQVDTALGPNWRQACVHIIFGGFVGGLVLLLILLYSGVPIVGA